MLLKVYKSSLNKSVTHTASFSTGTVRFGWTPPAFFSQSDILVD